MRDPKYDVLFEPVTKRDIANLRRWHRQAVDRSLRAGFDLVYEAA